MYLQHLELRLGAPLYTKFDLIAGVSTGSIIATALAGGMSAERLVWAYQQELPGIFRRPWWKFWAGYVGGPKYDKKVLRGALRRMLPMHVLGEARTGLMIYANQIAPRSKTKFWKSWRPEDAGLSAVHCVAASCSAPTYFAPEEYLDGVYVDGGLATNDPGAAAIAEVLRRAKVPAVCLDLQVSHAAGMGVPEAMRKTSAIDWLPTLIGDTISFGQDASAYIAETMLGSTRYLKVDLGSTDPMDATGPEFNTRCARRAQGCWLLSEDNVDDLMNQP
jgi:predicted acylesterase/phospholipase RssA